MLAFGIVVGCILLFLICYLIGRLYVLKYSLSEIRRELKWIHAQETNALLSVSSRDKNLLALVVELNESLSIIRAKELKYNSGNYEVQKIISNVAHDLRTPLTAILGYTELLEKEAVTSNSTKYIKVIKSRTKDLMYLSEQLFDFMQQKEQLEITRESVCLNQELETALFSYFALFKENHIEPKIVITPIKLYRFINREMLTRIFDNLIYNAIKYGGKELEISLTLSGKIIFSNPTSELDSVGVQKIFDRYYTLENARKTKGGAGLAIVKELVELNQGSITAKLENGWLIITLDFNSIPN